MGELLEPKSGVWCRQRWCRTDAARVAGHFDGDGCTCHGHAAGQAGASDAEPPAASAPFDDVGSPRAAEDAFRLTILTARASRLAAFACRACGSSARRMIEAPEMFFRCEECARAGRWPPSRRRA
jgi:hypothetical protein